VAEDLFHLAVKLRTHVVFVATRAGEKAVNVKFERATGEPRTADELIAAFVAFLHEHIESTRPQFRN
jgi:hypothetical protein